jgi:hypothetical protein
MECDPICWLQRDSILNRNYSDEPSGSSFTSPTRQSSSESQELLSPFSGTESQQVTPATPRSRKKLTFSTFRPEDPIMPVDQEEDEEL